VWWDRQLVIDGGPRAAQNGSMHFTDWYRKYNFNVIIWVCCGRRAQVEWVKKQGVATGLVASCNEDNRTLVRRYETFHFVMAPSHTAFSLLHERFYLKNVLYCPWSPASFITSKPSRGSEAADRPVRVFFPLQGCAAWGAGHASLLVIKGLLLNTNAHIVVARSRLRPRLEAALRGAESRYLTRLTVLNPRSVAQYYMLYGMCDLTASLCKIEPFTMDGLCSLHAGTPVVTFDVPMTREVIRDGVNGILVKDETHSPVVTFRDATNFYQSLLGTIMSNRLLAYMTISAGCGLLERHADFVEAWDGILAQIQDDGNLEPS
jgi:glycosyltransferase involved in cell wall biosynthesis